MVQSTQVAKTQYKLIMKKKMKFLCYFLLLPENKKKEKVNKVNKTTKI